MGNGAQSNMKGNVMDKELDASLDGEVRLLGEHLAVELSTEEIDLVSGARWVTTVTVGSAWGENPFCPCPDRDFVN